MKTRAIAGVAAVAAAVGLVLSGCGSDTKTESTSSSKTSTKSPSSSATAAPSSKPKVAPRDENAVGPNPTIASYIQENGIQEAQVNRDDPGSPTIDLPVPDGWEPAGENTPDWAYGAITYTGPEGADYTPSIVAMLSKLTGNVDPQKIIDLAPGEMNNLPGFQAWNEGAVSTLGDYPAFQLGGTWQSDGMSKISAQKTVVIPGQDGLYVLQLNADGLEDQSDIITAATDVIDSQTTIAF
jgi:probable lipoprotein LpqN